MKNILFLCTGNSARSILAEAVTNHFGKGRVTAYSAGSFPKGEPHALALELLQKQGVETAGLRSKSWDEFSASDAPVLDAIVTVCDSAAGEVCPIWPGRPVKVHWGLPDPPAAGNIEQQRAAFESVYNILKNRISEFLRLPVEQLSAEETQSHLRKIAEYTP